MEFQTNLPSQRLVRGQIGVVVSTGKGIVHLAMRDGSKRLFEPARLPRNLTRDAVRVHAVKVIKLHEGDRMLERFDLAYALNAYGVTTPHGIVMTSAGEPKLASATTLLVAMTWIADRATLIVDSGRNLGRAVAHKTGGKTSALEVAKPVPEKHLSLDELSDGRERSRDLGMNI